MGKEKKSPKDYYHSKGAEVLRETVVTCRDLGIKYLLLLHFAKTGRDPNRK